MAQLPPPPLLLGGRQGGQHRARQRGARLAHPTISGQIHRLEEVLGEKLFARRGRNLVLTEAGRVAFRYADEIFSLGREFVDTLKGRASGRPLRLVVGVADVLPPSLVRRFLRARISPGPARAGRLPRRQVGRGVHRRAGAAQGGRGHRGWPGRARHRRCARSAILLGECGTTFFAAAKLAAKIRRKFPRSLDGAPFLLPGAPSTVRRALEQWFDAEGIRPQIVAECDDSALAKDFGEEGMGVFAAPRSSRPRSCSTTACAWSGGRRPFASSSMPSPSSARSNTRPWSPSARPRGRTSSPASPEPEQLLVGAGRFGGAAGHLRRLALGDQRLGGQHEAGHRGRVLQRRAHDLGRVDDARP